MHNPIFDGINKINGYQQRIYRFENGYGASAIRGHGTYGGDAGLFELAVVQFDGDGQDDYALHYENEVADGDVVGYLKEADVQRLLSQIASFTSEADDAADFLGARA